MYVDLFLDVRTSCHDLRLRVSGRIPKKSTSQGSSVKSLAFPFGIASDSAENRCLLRANRQGFSVEWLAFCRRIAKDLESHRQ